MWIGALALTLTMVRGALAQGSLPAKPINPAVWHPQDGAQVWPRIPTLNAIRAARHIERLPSDNVSPSDAVHH